MIKLLTAYSKYPSLHYRQFGFVPTIMKESFRKHKKSFRVFPHDKINKLMHEIYPSIPIQRYFRGCYYEHDRTNSFLSDKNESIVTTKLQHDSDFDTPSSLCDIYDNDSSPLPHCQVLADNHNHQLNTGTTHGQRGFSTDAKTETVIDDCELELYLSEPRSLGEYRKPYWYYKTKDGIGSDELDFKRK